MVYCNYLPCCGGSCLTGSCQISEFSSKWTRYDKLLIACNSLLSLSCYSSMFLWCLVGLLLISSQFTWCDAYLTFSWLITSNACFIPTLMLWLHHPLWWHRSATWRLWSCAPNSSTSTSRLWKWKFAETWWGRSCFFNIIWLFQVVILSQFWARLKVSQCRIFQWYFKIYSC
jgi:hypothetical protein